MKSRRKKLIGHAFVLLLGMALAGALVAPNADTQNEGAHRKVTTRVPPEYPELARRLNIKGTARVQATVTAEGRVIKVKELGGNPVLLDALVRAVKKWRYEPENKSTVEEVKVVFE